MCLDVFTVSYGISSKHKHFLSLCKQHWVPNRKVINKQSRFLLSDHTNFEDFTSSFYRGSKKINNALRRWYWAIVMLNKSRRGLLKVSNAQKTTHMIFWEIDLILDGKFLTLLDVWVRLWCQIQSNSYFGFALYTLFHHYEADREKGLAHLSLSNGSFKIHLGEEKYQLLSCFASALLIDRKRFLDEVRALKNKNLGPFWTS